MAIGAPIMSYLSPTRYLVSYNTKLGTKRGLIAIVDRRTLDSSGKAQRSTRQPGPPRRCDLFVHGGIRIHIYVYRRSCRKTSSPSLSPRAWGPHPPGDDTRNETRSDCDRKASQTRAESTAQPGNQDQYVEACCACMVHAQEAMQETSVFCKGTTCGSSSSKAQGAGGAQSKAVRVP